jgi:beta-barrel assembly-enhancing protease
VTSFRCATALTLFAICAAAEKRSANDFKFGELEEKLLQEVEAVDRQFDKKGLVFTDPALDAWLDGVAKPLVNAAGTPERVKWRFRVLRDPSINAFALPNGSIYVHTGMLSVLENDAQLAGVLAHEITHVTNRHTFEQYRSYRKKSVALHVLAAVSAYVPTGSARALGSVWGSAVRAAAETASLVVALSVIGYSRELEREADEVAVDRVAAAGYDAMQIPRTFQLLEEKLEVEPYVTFYRDHPKLETRVKYTTELAKAKVPATARPVGGASYLAMVSGAMRYNIQADIDSRRMRTAVARAQRLVDFKPDAENTFLLAEAYRSLGPRPPKPDKQELSDVGKTDARRSLAKHTIEEEDRTLAAKPLGAQARQANRDRAEALYKKLQDDQPGFADSYRGLGFLYEEEGRAADARAAYRKYLELAPAAPDRLRIERRIEGIAQKLPAEVRQP